MTPYAIHRKGRASTAEIGWVLATCAVLVAVFGPATMRLYRRER